MSGEGNSRDNGRFNWFRKCFPCFNPGQEQDDLMSSSDDGSSSNGNNLTLGSNDCPKLWTYCDLVKHDSMLYSWATSKAEPGRNNFCRIDVEELRPNGIYVGLFDGHGSSDLCAVYTYGHMLKNLHDSTRTDTIEEDLIQAFQRTDKQWLELVSARFEDDPLIAAAGTSSLVAVIGGDLIYLANGGDSRAMMGKINDINQIIPCSLNKEDYLNDAREELQPEPDFILKDSNGEHTIKGRSQVWKSIGDVFLKRNRFNLNKYPEYRLNTSITISDELSATPFTKTTTVQHTDQFIIFGSKELWNLITTREAVTVVQLRKPRKKAIAALLIRYALNKIAKKLKMTYRQLQKAVSQGNWNSYYNDIGVVVVYFKETSTGITTIAEEVQHEAGSDIQSTSTDYSTGLEDEEGPDYFSSLEEFEVEGYEAVASSSGGGGNVASSSGGGGDAVASSSGGEGDAVASSSGGGDVASSSGGEGDAVASSSRGGENVASSSGGEGDVAS